MKKILIAGLAALTTTATAATAIAVKKAKAKKAELQSEKDAANVESISEELESDAYVVTNAENNDSNEAAISLEKEELLYEVDKLNGQVLQERTEAELLRKKLEGLKAKESEAELFMWTAQYCPRTEDGEECKKKHDTNLETGDERSMFVFMTISGLDICSSESWDAHFKWSEREDLVEELKAFFAYTENKEFVLDYLGFELSGPIAMGHTGNDPKKSIIIRPYHINDKYNKDNFIRF